MKSIDYIIIPLIFLEEFVKRSLMGIYLMYMKFEYWNFNRNLDEKNKKFAEQNPLPYHDRT